MQVAVDTNILWIIFFIMSIIFFVGLGIFSYHWGLYGVKPEKKKIVQIIYSIVSVLILLSIFLLILIYSKTNGI